MAINSSFTLSLGTGDGLTGNTSLIKQVTGLSYPTASSQSFSFPQLIGIDPPSAPAPTTRLAVPSGVSAVASTSGGSLTAATYFYVVTARNAVGETTGSTEVSAVITGTTGSVALSWTAVAGATSYRIYRGTSASGENAYF